MYYIIKGLSIYLSWFFIYHLIDADLDIVFFIFLNIILIFFPYSLNISIIIRYNRRNIQFLGNLQIP